VQSGIFGQVQNPSAASAYKSILGS